MSTSGKFPGFDYTISQGECLFCGTRKTLILHSSQLDKALYGICEPCTSLSIWAWQNTQGVAPLNPFPTVPGASLALIVRDRPDDPIVPYDVLMVARKDDPGAFGLPGGKLDWPETPEEAASRELYEETGLGSHSSSMDSLYLGYSPRGRLVKVFLCRAYWGEPESKEGLEVAWKPWPPAPHAGRMSAYYEALTLAFNLRRKMHVASFSTAPLSLKLGISAVQYLETMLEHSTPDGRLKPDVARYVEGLKFVMTSEESEITQVALASFNRTRDSKAIARLPRAEAPDLAPAEDPMPEGDGEETEAQGDMALDQDGDEEQEEGDEGEGSKGSGEGFQLVEPDDQGFVRPGGVPQKET